MMNHFRVVAVWLMLLTTCLMGAEQVSRKADWTVDLKTYGWTPGKTQSNKAFFKDFSLQKLEALDDNTHLAFVSNERIAVFHTKSEGENWRTASRQLEAFFVNASNGRLASKEQWPSIMRGSGSDLIDSESRLVPLTAGRFLIVANRTMLLYGEDFKLLNQKRLEPSGSGDLWSVQAVDDGKKIFLRHQSAAKQETWYQWLDGDTLRRLAEMAGPSGLNFSVAVIAGDNFVLTALPLPTRGITRAGLDGSTKVICSEALCRDDHVQALSSQWVMISGRRGIGVVDIDRGRFWSKLNPAASDLNEFQFGGIRTANSADMFALWITAVHKQKFDGVEVRDQPIVFVYQSSTGKLLFHVPVKRGSGNFDFALSPDGHSLAVFDGIAVSVYSTPAQAPKS